MLTYQTPWKLLVFYWIKDGFGDFGPDFPNIEHGYEVRLISYQPMFQGLVCFAVYEEKTKFELKKLVSLLQELSLF